MNENEQDKHEEVGRKAYDKLRSIGIPAVVAAAIIGAVYALAVALGIITLPGCTATYTQTADGDVQVHATVVTPTK